MKKSIAIRKENIVMTEKRSPLAPKHIHELTTEKGIKVFVEPWHNRHFNDTTFYENGAEVSKDLDKANIVFGVKEIPIEDLPTGKAAVFFSHTIKGQSYNMPLLQAVLDKKVSLMDYEKVTDENGKRLIFFGPYAGLAGAINAIWLLGQRLEREHINNPFSYIKQANQYPSLDEARFAFAKVAEQIRLKGLPQSKHPWVIAITGNGTVSKGAQEIIDLLPTEKITPKQFKAMQKERSFDTQTIYSVVIDADNFVKPKDSNTTFAWNDYFNHPEKYEADFEQYLPDITVLINGIYWDTMYPKLVTKDFLETLYHNEKQPNLRIIADITCDVEGSIECNLKSTASDNPTYVYNPFARTIEDGISGIGPVILAVDKLPSELPGEATTFFGNALFPFVEALAAADFSVPFNALQIPAEFKRALIAHQGKLTPEYSYLEQYL